MILTQRLLTDGSSHTVNEALAAAPQTAGEKVAVRLRVNGSNYGLRLDPRVSLLDLLREQLNLAGPPGGASAPHRHSDSAFIYAYVVSGQIASQRLNGCVPRGSM